MVSNDSYPFPTYSGLLEPEHYQRIGNAIWLFLWCISSTTKEVEKDGTVWGIVKGNKPHKLSDLAEIFNVNEKTVRRWLDSLEQNNYIRITRAPYGLILTVKNSKKYKNRLDKNVQSQGQRERTKVSTLPAKMSTLSDKNVQSNKDITVDITKDIIKDVVVDTREEKNDVDLIADYFMIRHGKPGFAPRASDYKEIKAVISSGVSLEEIMQGIDQSFDEYVAKYTGDEITSFAYCKKVILSNFYRDQAREDAKTVKATKPKKYNKHEAPLPKWMTGEQVVEEKTPEEVEKRKKEIELLLNNL